MNIYYVYAYLRESDNTPYYIGKGKGDRAYRKHNVSVPNDKTKIVFLHENLPESEAFEMEKFYIGKYGRKDVGTGILRNLTDGGEGASGLIVTEYSIEARKKNIKIHGNKVWEAAARSNSRKQKHLYKSGESHIAKGNKETAQCPICKQIGQRNAMLRWHFSNCKK